MASYPSGGSQQPFGGGFQPWAGLMSPYLPQMLSEQNPYLAMLNQLLGHVRDFRSQYPRGGPPILDVDYGFSGMGGSEQRKTEAPQASQTPAWGG